MKRFYVYKPDEDFFYVMDRCRNSFFIEPGMLVSKRGEDVCITRSRRYADVCAAALNLSERKITAANTRRHKPVKSQRKRTGIRHA